MVCRVVGRSVAGLTSVLLFAGVGCGVDLADGGGAGDTDTGEADSEGSPGTTGTPSDDDAGGTTGATGLTGPGDGSGSDTDGGPVGTGGEDTGEDASDCNLGCSGYGSCEVLDDGPTCVCEKGFATTGLDCIPCEPIESGLLPAEVPAVRAAFSFLHNGVEPPRSGLQYGKVSLRNQASGDVVDLGRTNDLSASVLMIPGTYDVLYEHRQGNQLPRNGGAVLQQVEIGGDDTTIDLDIESQSLRGALSFSGGVPMTPGLDYGRIWLVNPKSGDRTLIGDTRDEVYQVNVVPGTYEIRYEYRQTQDVAPINTDGLIGFVDVFADGEGTVHDIDVPTTRLTGAIEIDGSTVMSGLDNGDIELRDTETGDRFLLGETEDGDYEAVVVPGIYEVVYTSRQTGPLAPLNRGSVVETLIIEGGSAQMEHDIQLATAAVSGAFTVNTQMPPTDDFDDGLVLLQDDSGGTVALGNTRFGSFSGRVLAGSYEVVYAQATASQTMPVNTYAHLQKAELLGDTTLDVNIPVTEVVGTMTIGGAPAPDSAYDDGRLFLRNLETGDSVLLGSTRQGTYAARVVPGIYDVVYQNEISDTLLPINQGSILQAGVAIGGDDAMLDIDVPVETLSGNIEIQSGDPSAAEGIGRLYLRDLATDDVVFIGDTGSAAEFSKPLTDGTYLMEYRGVAAAGATLGTSLPANENAAFACFEIVSG